ncbi:P-loop containing nucleoside triphosphate hydrolase protein [Cristinia sonorae]|uniref:P-loop containing nucleoside triphosphate hydrolase protein n=1 Tax=Cristinia sonorae TaxID=1940300 RepID=A0A8K0UJB7_9AGAR|nr:P-loop containing nucleoside triphosphate hydrolase protein [Cristinia sonorae]
MPPRKGIVKSGNAGNSSKASSPTPVTTTTNEEKPLFPPGSKYPLSLLHERCQKNGWEKPNVDTRKSGEGHSFVVVLSRLNKKTSERESVRLEPHPPYITPTALEARHWGATYALYRFCNGIQLNRVLPSGPREYWNELAAEHKNAPEHQKWMYEADPFLAKKMVEERQARIAHRREESSQPERGKPGNPTAHGSALSEFSNAPEVKMASSLRDLIEETIKKAVSLHPDASDTGPTTLKAEETSALYKQLVTLGFTMVQASSATKALSQATAFASSLLSSLPPLQACLEYLILHVPECDLPPRFLPSHNSSNPFISAAHSGTDDLRRRWIEEKAVKECGWPAHVVHECMAAVESVDDWSGLIRALNGRLLGDPDSLDEDTIDSSGQVEHLDDEEVEGWNARFVEPSHLALPMPVAPIELHIMLNSDHTIPTQGRPPPMYITSNMAPAYIRLHLLSNLLTAFTTGSLLEPGESVIMACLRLLEEDWAKIEDDGPPEISTVLRHLLPKKPSLPAAAPDPLGTTDVPGHSGQKGRRRKTDNRSSSQVEADFLAIQQDPKFQIIQNARQKLPASAAEAEFLCMLNNNQCVVVVGETGCGKTTQLPQFILDSLIKAGHGADASIIITQPRRLSAIGVATRVSAERLDDGSVGYAIRGETQQTEKTKLLFCTTGVVLRRLASGDALQSVTHVIVDEVHERSVDGDILLLQLKEMLSKHKKLKVILMSATINHEIFIKYFNNAPLLTIPGFTHPVQDIYLESIMPLINYRPSNAKRLQKMTEEEKHKLRAEYSAKGLEDDCIRAIQTISRLDKIDFELVAAVVQHIVSSADKPAGILIFLPGVQEIRQCMERLRTIPNSKVFPLHANLSSDEQRAVFAPISQWKIIAATNVAETSITIDDIVYVVDCGKVKETQYDPENGLTKLVEQWVTRAAAKQRRGRAGRTRPGVCYKLFTKKQEANMSPFPIPEIKRVPLESVSLTVKVMKHDVKNFLSRALDPPNMNAMDHALSTLEELGAIADSGEVTPLGQHLATLPLDLRLGKMLILGTIFQCLGPVLTVAACVSSKPLFLNPMDKREEASRARERFTDGNSDLLTDVAAYNECLRRNSEGASQSAIRTFCEENFISASTLRDITSLRNDLFSALSSINLVPVGSTSTSPLLNANSTNTNLVKACILGGLWPRVARVSLPRSAIKFDKVQAGTIQRENVAKDYKFFDVKNAASSGSGGEKGVNANASDRVFLHPASVLFGATTWKSPFVTYFHKQMTSKVFLRDATEVPMYALLLFGGPVSVNHIAGGLTVGTKDAFVKLRAWPRIGILVNQLRRLLDAQLAKSVEEGTSLAAGNNPVVNAMLALLTRDGLTE